MVAAAREQLAELDVDPLPFTEGKPEQTIVWEDGGATCRARIDWLHTDGTAIDDYKTTSKSADPESFTRTLFSMGYDVQAAFYLRGLEGDQRGRLRLCLAVRRPGDVPAVPAERRGARAGGNDDRREEGRARDRRVAPLPPAGRVAWVSLAGLLRRAPAWGRGALVGARAEEVA
ncbi:MAG: PD-(D/E)XK nuclease-like domain-containing protein [Acidimicrobiia bacterium]|nr:PD-(D/E)XK nuclease-like domain-containing protein [Acidimicrobiia bacterium]